MLERSALAISDLQNSSKHMPRYRKLTDEQEKEIRRSAFQRRESCKVIAKRYRISQDRVYTITGGPWTNNPIEKFYV